MFSPEGLKRIHRKRDRERYSNGGEMNYAQENE